MTLRKLTYLFATLGLTLGFSSCDRKEDVADETISVYVAFNYDSITPNREVIHCGAIWNDGNIIKLSSGREDVYVYDVYMSPHGDLYAAGNFDKNPLYWKNGEEHILTSGRAATGIGILNGKVYCCGYNTNNVGDQAMMWVDGEAQELKYGSRCNRLCIGNGKCYIAGYGEREMEGEIKEDALVWENGKPMSPLAQSKSGVDNYASANDVVCGDAVWIVGREKANTASWLPKVWVDYTHNNLTSAGMDSRLNAIVFENGTYYIAGNDGLKATYWTATQKSKTERRPANVKSVVLADKTPQQSTVSDIAVIDGNVYCVGYTRLADNYQPKLWVNGKDENFAFPKSYSNVVPQSIVLVKKEK